MNHEQQSSPSQWGFVSPDGKFLPVASLTSLNLEYASRSLAELNLLINDYSRAEAYEKCAVIRDEILRRSA